MHIYTDFYLVYNQVDVLLYIYSKFYYYNPASLLPSGSILRPASDGPAPRATRWGFATIFGTVQIVLMGSHPEGPAANRGMRQTALLIIKYTELHQPLEGKYKGLKTPAITTTRRRTRIIRRTRTRTRSTRSKAKRNKNKRGTRRPSRNNRHHTEIRARTFREGRAPENRRDSTGETGRNGIGAAYKTFGIRKKIQLHRTRAFKRRTTQEQNKRWKGK